MRKDLNTTVARGVSFHVVCRRAVKVNSRATISSLGESVRAFHVKIVSMIKGHDFTSIPGESVEETE